MVSSRGNKAEINRNFSKRGIIHRRGVDFFILISILFGGTFLGAVAYLNAQGIPDFPDACLTAGITDPIACREYMENLFKPDVPDSFTTQDSNTADTNNFEETAPGEQIIPQACPEDCGQCKTCDNGVCVLLPFGTPADTWCAAGQSCDGKGGCVSIGGDVESLMTETKKEEYHKALNTDQEKPALYTETETGEKPLQPLPNEFQQFLPEPCKAAGIPSMEQCMEYMKGMVGLEEGDTVTKHKSDDGTFLPPFFGNKKIDEQNFEGAAHNDFRGQQPEEFGSPGMPSDFESFLPPECRKAGVTSPDECQGIMFTLDMPPECKDAHVRTPKECEQLMTKQYMPQKCKKQGIETMDECENLMIATHMPPECKKQGIETMDECEKVLASTYSPKICQEKGAVTDADCEKIVFAAYGRPQACEGLLDAECKQLILEGKIEAEDFMQKLDAELPPRCLELGAKSFKECEEISMKINIPPECKEAGAFTRKACEKVMMEQYQPSADFMPRPCQEAELTDPRDCKKLMKAKYFPEECGEAGITTEDACHAFLIKKHMPPECRKAGVTTRDACEELLRTAYMAPECKDAGIFDTDACEQMMKDKYAKNVQCEGISDDECGIAIAKRHLGHIVKKQKEFETVKDEITNVIGKHITLGKKELTEGVQPPATTVSAQAEKLKALLPLVSSAGKSVLVLSAAEGTVITEDESLIQSLPAAVMVDSDRDGLPDDIEGSIGTNANNPDSDSDGFDDSQEVQNGFNPLGEGTLETKLEPVEEAIIDENVELEQPLVSGKVSEELTVTEESAKAEGGTPAGEGAGTDTAGPLSKLVHFLHRIVTPVIAQTDTADAVTLQGKGPAGKVVTIYVYSDIPLIATTKVSADGLWIYTIDEPLVDGEHKVYVAINDRNGNVVSKSNPASFLIEGAKAVTAEEFIAPSIAEPSLVNQWRWYIVFILGIVGLIVVITFVIYRKRSKTID